ncbi:cyclin-dependent kinase inhibitor 7-like isoform X2 [Bidens hawaiensis]|uniref:cyclin-dependent kinase inhibitor 7-like isoform X2 n=1 Tax=Bidens hawaiensis TaxID=980011 RepID=UPI004048FC74
MELGNNEVKQCGLVVVMEVTQVVGVKTRARAMAMAKDEVADNSVAVKRRKLGNEKLKSPSPVVETKSSSDKCEVHVNLNSVLKEKQSGCNCEADVSTRSGGVTGSCCSSTGSIEKLIKVSDLESVDQSETTAINNLDGNESIPCEVESTAVEKQSTVMNNSRRKVLPVEKMPPEAELEKFFASAQKDLNERFKNKYNYDIVNDIPLEGRFEWIQVNQEK